MPLAALIERFADRRVDQGPDPRLRQEGLPRRRRRRPPARAVDRAAGLRRIDALQEDPAQDGAGRQAGGRRDQRQVPGRRPGDRAGLPSPHRARRRQGAPGPARGQAGPAARRRRHAAHAAAGRHAAGAAVDGRRQRHPRGAGAEVRPGRRTGDFSGRPAREGARLDPREPGAEAAVGHAEVPLPRRRLAQPGRGADVLDRAVHGVGQELRQLSGASRTSCRACSRAASSASTRRSRSSRATSRPARCRPNRAT